TSLINLAASDHRGAAPLVDLSDLAARPLLAGAPAGMAPSMGGRGLGGPGLPPGPGLGVAFGPTGRQTTIGDLTGVVVGHGARRQPSDTTAERQPDRPPMASKVRSVSRRPAPPPWLIIAIILLTGLGTAVAIGLSGPSLDQ